MNISTMILVSVGAGFLSTMNVFAVNKNHIKFHLNDVYMVMFMTSLMILLMVFLNSSHYENSGMITLVSLTSAVLFFSLIRKQIFVDDSNYLNGMIPHHSMAIKMSEEIRNKTTNPEIKKLATDIILAQTNEINYMERLLCIGH